MGGDPATGLPPGVVLDEKGRMCKLDKRGRYYQVGEDGMRITKRGTTRPAHFGAEWWLMSDSVRKDVRQRLGLDKPPEKAAPAPPLGLDGFAKPCAELTEVFVKGKLTSEASSVLEPGGSSETDVPPSSPDSDTDPDSGWNTESDKESVVETSDSAPSLQDESDNESDCVCPDRGGPDEMEPWDIDWDADAFASSEEFAPSSAAASYYSGGDPAVKLATANDDSVPSMPCRRLQRKSKKGLKHRVKNQPSVSFNACVARPVSKKEVSVTPKAKAAVQAEWDRLASKKAWDTSVVKEWSTLANEARAKGTKIHFGYVFCFCVEKNSELQPELRKYKGRAVFQGNKVVDQNWDVAMFQDLGSNPANMDASRAADCYGCFPGHGLEIADAEQAYIQADLKGTETWVCLPWEARTEGMKKSKWVRPVVRLTKALYGHPDSGTFWEDHCDKESRKVGFKPIGPTWPS